MIEQKVINTIRKLALDEIAEANSGHPGIALGIAPMLFALYNNGVTFNPKNSDWFNRDRVVLSCGHGSAVLYSTLHLFGYNIQSEDLQQFRKLGSRTPGHPEFRVTDGIDASTGALGNGFATAVGMALAESHIRAKYNRKGVNICDHYTFVVCSDGDLMEGISYEASSLAGNFKLNKLIALYDSNGITMTDKLSMVSNENVELRFKACGWQVIKIKQGEDYKSIEKAIARAKQSKEKPTMIICNTVIGYGSKFAGSAKCHGKPFNKQEVAEICSSLGLSTQPFAVDEEVVKYCKEVSQKHEDKYSKWLELSESYKKEFPTFYKELFGEDKKSLLKVLNGIQFNQSLATREASGIILNKLAEAQGNFFGGGADVAESTMAFIKEGGIYSANNLVGENLPFGVREHAMSAIANGIALHGGLRTFASTFTIFSDYMRYGIRQSALMDLPVWYILTHDSVWVGEDGPSHQPIEQVEGLRLIPNLAVFRPADARETIAGYHLAIENFAPTALILSRQKLPILEGSNEEKARFGGYVVSAEKKKVEAILIARGSEVSLCVEAQKLLWKSNIDTRVVSMPCGELFLKQDKKYQNSVLPKKCLNRVAVDVGITQGWRTFVGDNGITMGINFFGESGAGADVVELFGITVDNVVKNVKKLVK